jgi:hypothetical protein
MGRSAMDLSKKLIKEFEEKPLDELVDAPVYALQGLSKKDAVLLDKAFYVRTIRDLAELKYIKWAREIVELAESGKDIKMSKFKDRLIKKYEDKKPSQLARAPLHALQGLSEKDTKKLHKAFKLKTVSSLARLKYAVWAEEIIEAHKGTPGRSRKILRCLWKIFLIACLALIVIVVFRRCYPQIKSFFEKKRSTVEKVVPVDEDKKLAEEEVQPGKEEPVDTAKIDAEQEGEFYIVQEKDELRDISKKLYGDSMKWKRIYETNKDKIKDPNLIFPGQKLRIPEKETK